MVDTVQNRRNNPEQGYGTLANLFAKLMAAFTVTTSVQEAMHKVKSLKMGNSSANEHTAQFELLVDQADLATAGEAILINFYHALLAPWLIERIYQGEVPNMLAQWKARAILLDHNKRLAASFTGGGQSGGGFNSRGGKKKFTFRRYPEASSSKVRDDDAMDMDRLAVEIQCLSFEEQGRLMAKGLCFNCKKPGHFAANCPEKKKNPPKAKQNGYQGKGKPKVCATFMNICALVSQLSDGEMEEFQDLVDNKGFGEGEGEDEGDLDF